MLKTTQRIVHLTLAASMVFSLAGCTGGGDDERAGGNGAADDRPTFAYVTNGVDPFWVIAEAGAEQAGRDLGCEVIVRMPHDATAVEQNRILEELAAQRNMDGIAISPIDGVNQNEKINEIAARIPLITHDSDAPDSERLVFIGVDNYKAGRMAGELMKQALPEGGEVVIFIGRLEQDNARFRTQGAIDALLDRDPDPTRRDEPGQTLTGGKFTVLDVRTDGFSSERALSQAEDALARYPGVDGMIGLFAYNPPAILNALEQAGKLGEVKVVGFDEQDPTLQGIRDGVVIGTVVQDPYSYGYESIRILNELHQGNDDVIPEGEVIDVRARKITQENLEEFWTDLREKRGD